MRPSSTGNSPSTTLWLASQQGEHWPKRLAVAGRRSLKLRYGENPHQQAALYTRAGDHRPGVANCEQLQGKELSYNNINDADAAFELADEAAISLTESALRQIEFDPVRPIPSYGSTNAMYVVGRNAADSDRITIIWEVRGQDYADYTVRLNRDDDGIIAAIYKNWWQDPKR